MGSLLAHKTRAEIFEEAEKKYLELLQSDPDNKQLNLNLAVTMYNLGKHEEATALFLKYEPKHKDSEKDVSNLGDNISNNNYGNGNGLKGDISFNTMKKSELNDNKNNDNDSKVVSVSIIGDRI